jgi:TorA maturation chaperone TorD
LIHDILFKERGLIYRVLSLALYTPLDQEAQEELRLAVGQLSSITSLQSLRDAVNGFRNSWLEAWNMPREKLLEEYTRLFTNDYPELKCPPYETFWVTGERVIYGPTIKDLEEIYKTAGLEPQPGVKLPIEHVALQLELMHYLVSSSLTQEQFLCLQEKMFQNHIQLWGKPYAECLERTARLNCYKATALLLRDFINLEETLFKSHSFCEEA